MSKKITIITVCYNAENDIKKTMMSVLLQTYHNIEYIVIDGASKDRTLSIANNIAKEFKEKEISIYSEPDNGIYDAMNKGIMKASGDWIIFMNAGDTFTSMDIIADVVDELSSDIRILRGNIIRKYNRISVKSCGVTSQDPRLIDMFNNTFHHQACFIQRALFMDFGLYSTEYKLCSDWKFFFDCVVLHQVKTKYIDKTVAFFEMDGASSKNILKYSEEREDYLKKVLGDDVFSYLKELDLYRKSTIATLCYKFRRKLMNSISPRTFNILLTAKRMIRAFFHLNVN